MLVFLAKPSEAQLNIHEFDELEILQTIQERPVVVFIHTDWCGYCRKMENTTFEWGELVDTLNNRFHFIKLDAEYKEDITYKGNTFKFVETGVDTGVHELASALAVIDGKISYPTICVLNPDDEYVFRNPGFMTAEALLEVLKAVLE